MLLQTITVCIVGRSLDDQASSVVEGSRSVLASQTVDGKKGSVIARSVSQEAHFNLIDREVMFPCWTVKLAFTIFTIDLVVKKHTFYLVHDVVNK